MKAKKLKQVEGGVCFDVGISLMCCSGRMRVFARSLGDIYGVCN